MPRSTNARKPRPQYTAKTADKQILYQESVQSPESEVAFCRRIYKKRYGDEATTFREDFCGTFLISCDWVKRGSENHAYGVDLHKPTIDWGVKHNLSRLKPAQQERVHLIHDNVLNIKGPKVQIVGAFNFSYFLFKTHVELVKYFSVVRKSLAPKGLFVLDAYGGWDSQKVMEEKRKCEGFTYIWNQAEYNPTNDHTLCHIHFHFPDGTRMRKAFSYDWRLWTLGGIRDCLADAGFSQSEVYWEGTTADGDGNGVFKVAEKGENCNSWTAYIVGIP